MQVQKIQKQPNIIAKQTAEYQIPFMGEVKRVPTFKMHLVGTVPMFKMHLVGTVPTFKKHLIGTMREKNL